MGRGEGATGYPRGMGTGGATEGEMGRGNEGEGGDGKREMGRGDGDGGNGKGEMGGAKGRGRRGSWQRGGGEQGARGGGISQMDMKCLGGHMECLGGTRLQSFLTLFTRATPGTPASLY